MRTKLSIYFKPLFFYLGVILCFCSCRKLVEVDSPTTSLNGANVYASDATAASVLSGIYAKISSNANITNGGLASVFLFTGLSSDELTLFNASSQTPLQYLPYYQNALNSQNTGNPDFWNQIYPIIFSTNSAVEGLSSSTTLTPSVKKQLLGEAKFIRAFCYFYLVNLYGDLPLILGTDYEINRLAARIQKSLVYKQIIADLIDAQGLLNDGYIKADRLSFYPSGSYEKIHPNKWVATALLARSYLYTGDYVNAETQSSLIINNPLYSLSSLTDVFKKNSNEAIWQLQPVSTTPTTNTWEAWLFILPSTGPTTTGTFPVYLNNNIITAFETGDLRKSNWTGNVPVGLNTYYYPSKYKIAIASAAVAEYNTVFRLGEQYLIRAEARAQQNKISEAQADLNVLRSRANLPSTAANDKTSLVSAILHERQVELFTEWGHRWLDLKRTGNVDAVMSTVTPQKGGLWNTNWQLYPIPTYELQKDPSLVQNSGY